MLCKEIGLIGFGAILGFASSILFDWVRRIWDRCERRRRGKRLLLAIIKEIEEGGIRCEGLIRLMDEDKISFSRIYTSFWDSMKVELAQSIDDLEVLRLLHSIYYRFDLVNFNMEQGRFGRGAGQAKAHLPEIQENLSKLKARLGSL